MSQSPQEIISRIVRERFADAIIDSVIVTTDEDSDGDPILRVTVVLNSEIEKLEPGELAGLARHVRPKIMECGDDAFPIFRFISKRDKERLEHAAA